MSTIPSVTLNNGITMLHLGLGVLFQPNDQTVQSVSAAFEAGYRFIGTASKYENEEAVCNSGLPREEIFVTSKLWNSDYSYDQAIKGFERSLKRLGLEYINLYLMHWPVPDKGLTIETWKGLEHVNQKGRVKAIGVSNFLPKHLERLLQEAEIVPAVLQIEVHPIFTKEESRQLAQQHGIQIESWFPLSGRPDSQEMLSLPVLTDLAKKYGKTPAQIVLRWHVELGLIPIPGSSNPEHIKENADIFNFALSQDEVAAMSALNKGIRLAPNPDTFARE